MQTNFKNSDDKPGVYKIINLIDDKVYIGSAKNFKSRFKQHIKSLEKNKHQNKHLQNAFNLYGSNAFLFEVIEVLEDSIKEYRFQIEQEYINRYKDNWESCYNFKKQTIQKERTCFSKTPEETSKKRSESMKKVWSSTEYKQELILKFKKSILTTETFQNRIKGYKKAWENNIQRKQKAAERTRERMKNGLREKLNSLESKIKRKKALEQYHINRHKELCSKQILETKDFEYPGIHCKIILNANLLSPQGILYKNITNIQKFAEFNNLSETKVRDLLKGKLLTFKNWVRLDNEPFIEKPTKIYKFISPNGEIIEVSNVSGLAKSFRLERGGFKSLISGRLKSYYNWKLFN